MEICKFGKERVRTDDFDSWLMMMLGDNHDLDGIASWIASELAADPMGRLTIESMTEYQSFLRANEAEIGAVLGRCGWRC